MTFIFVIATLAACSSPQSASTSAAPSESMAAGASAPAEGKDGKFLIGFSTDTTNSAWRSKMVSEMQRAVAEHSDQLDLIVTVAEDDTNKQISDIEDLVAQGIDLLVVSPHVADPLAPIVREVYQSGIPVIVVDRAITGEAGKDFTTFIGANNETIGKQAGEIIAETLNGKGNVIELQGTAGASPTIGRGEPMKKVLEGSPDIKIVASQDCDYNETKAMETMENLLQVNGEGMIDLVYAHADNMALGALKAIKAAGRENEGIKIVSIDAQKQAFEAIKEGTFLGTFTYPWPSEKAVEIALKIMNGETVEPSYDLESVFVTAENVDQYYDANSEY